MNYPKLSDSEELKFDDSFQLIPASEGDIFKVIQEEAVKRYLAGENVQVIATTRADVKNRMKRFSRWSIRLLKEKRK